VLAFRTLRSRTTPAHRAPLRTERGGVPMGCLVLAEAEAAVRRGGGGGLRVGGVLLA